MSIDVKHDGSFTKYCENNGLLDKDGHVTCKCIEKALKTDDKHLHKQAVFAHNFGLKNKGKSCSILDKI